ncbi:MAG: winged helix-turn-helix transcriptional regulator [Gammaproteobacteria bacterium]
MAGSEPPYRDDLEEAVSLIRGRWAISVLIALAPGRLRVSDLLAEVNERHARLGCATHQRPLTDKVLRQTLQPMEQAGLVVNYRESAAFAASSWYELTIHGKTLLLALRPLLKWHRHYRIERAGAAKPAAPARGDRSE